MAGELLTFQPEVLSTITESFTPRGWEVNSGYIDGRKLNVPMPHTVFRLTTNPSEFGAKRGNLFYGIPGAPIITGRVTPFDQRNGHLETVLEGGCTVGNVIEELLSHKQGTILTMDTMPMVDMLVFVPNPDQTLYLAGQMKYYGSEGMALVVDGPKVNTVWVDKPQGNEGILPITPVITDTDGKAREAGAFSITGVIDYPTLGAVNSNAIRVVTVTAPMKIVLKDYLGVDSGLAPSSIRPVIYGGYNTKEGMGFAQRGPNEPTGEGVERAKSVTGFNSGVIYNIFPIVLPPTLDHQQLMQLAASM